MSIKSLVKQSLIARENRKYQKALNARRMTYAHWQKAQTKTQVDIPFDLSEYVVLLAEDSTLTENALKRIGTYLAQHPGAQVVYADEDVAGEGGAAADESAGSGHTPYFKPDWSPDLLECCFYIGSMAVVHEALLQRVSEQEPEYRELLKQVKLRQNTLEEAKAGVQIFSARQEALRRSLIKACIVRAGGYEKRGEHVRIGHVPEVLCHCKSIEKLSEYARPKDVPGTAYAVMEQVVSDATRVAQTGEIQTCGLDKLQGHKLSVIIPSKDHPDLVEKCIRAVLVTEKHLELEILVVDNGSSAENRAQCEKLLGVLVDEGVQVKYFYRPMEFNFSAMCNLGAEQASGDLLLFLNDDVELTLENTLTAMARKAVQPHVGAVGVKLYYPEGNRIQHGGITNLPMGPVHKLQFMQDDEACYFFANKGSRNMLAVTAACLMVTRDKFREAGEFPEKLQVAFNDVALCFGLHSLGYYNVVLNDLYAYHHESLSRGDDEADGKLKRLLKEKAELYTMYPGLEGVDPYYSENLCRVGLDTHIRPAYETAGNTLQQVAGMKTCTELEGYRPDNCLMVRVEDCSNEVIVGYAVVLCDNNACYEKELLLKTEDRNATAEKDRIYRIPIEGQYRPDLVENMPDQVHVGLCGFWVQGDLPAGGYRIGVAARNRVTGTKLVNFSNRILDTN